MENIQKSKSAFDKISEGAQKQLKEELETFQSEYDQIKGDLDRTLEIFRRAPNEHKGEVGKKIFNYYVEIEVLKKQRQKYINFIEGKSNSLGVDAQDTKKMKLQAQEELIDSPVGKIYVNS